MSGVYGPAVDSESIVTIRRALDLGVNLIGTSSNYGKGHNHRLIREAIRGHRDEYVIHSKSGSPPEIEDGVEQGGGDPEYLRKTCEQNLMNLGIDTLDVFCMSRVDPNVPVEESVGAMVDLVTAGKTRFIALSEASADSIRRGNSIHPLASLQMEYSLLSRDAEAQGQIAACKQFGMALVAYGALGRGLLSAEAPTIASMAKGDIRAKLPRFQDENFAKNTRLRVALEAIARNKNITLPQLSIAWSLAQSELTGTFILPIPGAKSRKHLEENVKAAEVEFSSEELREIDALAPFGAAAGTRYPADKMLRVNI
jgi:aryl-alcohol dehydrogenase-like predicted oxidoreductase